MQFKGTTLLFIVFVILGGYVYLAEFRGKDERQKQEDAKKKLSDLQDKIEELKNPALRVEHTQRDGNSVTCDRTANPGDFINLQGAEAKAEAVLLDTGVRISYPQVAQFMGVLFSDIWAALDRDIRMVRKLGAIEFQDKKVILTAVR